MIITSILMAAMFWILLYQHTQVWKQRDYQIYYFSLGFPALLSTGCAIGSVFEFLQGKICEYELLMSVFGILFFGFLIFALLAFKDVEE